MLHDIDLSLFEKGCYRIPRKSFSLSSCLFSVNGFVPLPCLLPLQTSDESDDLGEGGQDKQPEVIRHAQEPEAESSHAGEPVPHR